MFTRRLGRIPGIDPVAWCDDYYIGGCWHRKNVVLRLPVLIEGAPMPTCRPLLVVRRLSSAIVTVAAASVLFGAGHSAAAELPHRGLPPSSAPVSVLS